MDRPIGRSPATAEVKAQKVNAKHTRPRSSKETCLTAEHTAASKL